MTCLIVCVAIYSFSPPAAQGQVAEEQVIQAATVVLTETMATPGNQIPQAMLENASGVAIIPNVIKGSFIIGARHGRGLLFVRENDGIWHAPVFVTLTGGNVGWQVGVQSSDIILVFKTPRSIQGLLAGKLTIGGDASAAAGPVGRGTAIATDGQLQAEIYTYSRSRGLFAGVSIDGSVVQVDQFATGSYYRSPAPGQPVVVPPSALQLTATVASYAAGNKPNATVPAPEPAEFAHHPELVQQNSVSEADALRAQLTQLAPELYELIDDQWKTYLGLPSSMFLGVSHPSAQEVQAVIQKFNTVAADPRFASLASRPEFQSVDGLLKHYYQALTAPGSAIQLPPPPAN
ncbi:lipid-binding SYLF domain-containing protein [Novipirellula artificiosorum]|nr:lipid-binding SYLF domain-containing protein [Novipirellula artificiosorum]